MFIRLLRNTPRQAARLARRQHSRLAQKTSSVLVQQNRYSSSTTAAPYFEVDVVDGGIAIIRMDQPGMRLIYDNEAFFLKLNITVNYRNKAHR